MSSMDPMRDVFSIRSETMKNFIFDRHIFVNCKHKVIIIDESDNTTPDVQLIYGRLLRSLLATADLSSPVTIKTKSYLPSILDVPSSTSPSKEKTELNSQVSSSKDSNRSWIKKYIGYDPKVLAGTHQQTLP